MIFNSLAFMFFLPLVFLLYWQVFRRNDIRNVFVVLASYVFYGWWSWRFLVLIFITTLCSYLSGLGLERVAAGWKRKLVLWLNVGVNLAILCTFKYFNFFVDNLRALFDMLGFTIGSVTVDLILPVGISFYTFQALSYTIDVYRGKMQPTHDIGAFFAFISFFPQLVAGPIERATNLLPQFLKPRTFDYSMAVDGCRLMLWGFFKKMVVADNCAPLADRVFASYDTLGGIDLWIGALAFTFQIYGDFSGYSDIAIGCARLFGIRLMRNFKVPYFSRDVAEFWRRWHISLNTWFVDYVYIPLGGSRKGKGMTVRNTFAIFLLSGLWHGASWTYVGWGVYHATLFVPGLIAGKTKRFRDDAAMGRWLPGFKESFYMGMTFLLIAVGWVIFRADNLQMALHYIARMFTDFHYDTIGVDKFLLLWIGVMMVVEWLTRSHRHALEAVENGFWRYRGVRWCAYIALAVVCLAFHGQQEAFIYFQF